VDEHKGLSALQASQELKRDQRICLFVSAGHDHGSTYIKASTSLFVVFLSPELFKTFHPGHHDQRLPITPCTHTLSRLLSLDIVLTLIIITCSPNNNDSLLRHVLTAYKQIQVSSWAPEMITTGADYNEPSLPYYSILTVIMKNFTSLFALLSILAGSTAVQAATKEQWRDRSIYQSVTPAILSCPKTILTRSGYDLVGSSPIGFPSLLRTSAMSITVLLPVDFVEGTGDPSSINSITSPISGSSFHIPLRPYSDTL
jgi:hypothetical protein